jgi:hypothetical protein
VWMPMRCLPTSWRCRPARHCIRTIVHAGGRGTGNVVVQDLTSCTPRWCQLLNVVMQDPVLHCRHGPMFGHSGHLNYVLTLPLCLGKLPFSSSPGWLAGSDKSGNWITIVPI